MTTKSVDPEQAAIGWRLASAGDEQDAANWAYEHVEDLIAEVERLRGAMHKAVELLERRPSAGSSLADCDSAAWDACWILRQSLGIDADSASKDG
jgi:hypothetical protein